MAKCGVPRNKLVQHIGYTMNHILIKIIGEFNGCQSQNITEIVQNDLEKIRSV